MSVDDARPVRKQKPITERLREARERSNNLRSASVQEQEEDSSWLFVRPEKSLPTECKRCHSPLLLRIDPVNKDDDGYMLIER